jgi:hypothetical protein
VSPYLPEGSKGFLGLFLGLGSFAISEEIQRPGAWSKATSSMDRRILSRFFSKSQPLSSAYSSASRSKSNSFSQGKIGSALESVGPFESVDAPSVMGSFRGMRHDKSRFYVSNLSIDHFLILQGGKLGLDLVQAQ